MEVEHRGGIVARGMDRGMDDEAGAVHRGGHIVDLVAVEIDLDQRRGGDLFEHQIVRVDEEVMLGAGDARRDVREDEIGPAEVGDETIRRGEIDTDLPLLGGDALTNAALGAHGRRW